MLVFSIALVYYILPINTAVSQDSTSSVDNITAVTLGQSNATANATANATIAAALAEANKTLAEAEAEANKTLAEVEANKTLAEAEAEANKTLAEAEVEANKTLAEAEANKTLAEAERRANITQAVARQAFTDLPSSIAGVLGAAIVLVIAVPILTDLLLSHYRQNKQRSLGRPLGMAGLYRSVMAFGLIAVVSILVVYLVALVSFYIAIESPASTALISVLQNLGSNSRNCVGNSNSILFWRKGSRDCH